MIRGTAKNQYYAAICVNLGAVTYGIGCGWSSPSFPLLESSENTLPTGPLLLEELSWVSSIMCIGGLLGNLSMGWITDHVGRKTPLHLLAIPSAISWLLIAFSQNVYYLLISRLMVGFVGGATYTLVPLYIAEISEDLIRGSLGIILVLFTYTGILIAYVVGNYFTYQHAALIYLIIPILHFITVIFLPETPYYLMKTNKIEEAENSLQYFRNIRKDHENINAEYLQELENLKKINSSSCNNGDKEEEYESKIKLDDFVKPPALKLLLIGLVLIALNKLCGTYAMVNYTATIFKESGSNLSPNISAIIVGGIQIIGANISNILVDRAGRKFSIGVSALGTAIGLTIMGSYCYVKVLGYVVDNFNWIPLYSFSFAVFISSCGVRTLSFIVVAEILPEKIRSLGITICMTFIWILDFICMKYFYKLLELFEMHGCMFIFAGFCYAGSVFVYVVLPETKGKSFLEIQQLLLK